jgi:hypothetical protein
VDNDDKTRRTQHDGHRHSYSVLRSEKQSC